MAKVARRIETISDCVFLGQVLVEILQRSTCEVGSAEAAGEEVGSRARDSAKGIALGWVKEMMEKAEHFLTHGNSNDLTRSRAAFSINLGRDRR